MGFAISLYLGYRQLTLIKDNLHDLNSKIEEINNRCDENEKTLIKMSNSDATKNTYVIKKESPLDINLINKLEPLPTIKRDDTDNNIQENYNKFLKTNNSIEDVIENELNNEFCIVYSKSSCPFCEKAITELQSLFKELRIEEV